jgi:P27 family predicted phage terminase small subunit
MPAHKTPTSLKALHGTTRRDRLNLNEPSPERGAPPAPAHLTDKQREAWGRFAAQLDELGTITVADGTALEGLVYAYTQLVAAQAEIEARGITVEFRTARGGRSIRQNPAVQIAADAERRLQQWLAKFGLSPADRSRVTAAPKPDKKSGWDALDDLQNRDKWRALVGGKRVG